MSAADPLGNPVTGDDPAAMAGVSDFIDGMLTYQRRAVGVIAAADAAPGHCLVNAYAAALHLLAETTDAGEGADRYLARAEASPGGTRERTLVAAVRAWRDGEINTAIATLDRIVRAWPRDLLALKLLHYHQFNRGDFAGMLAAVQPALAAAGEVAVVHGMAAFAYEQLDRLDEAEESARHALAIEPREPWAEHAIAHVMLTTGRIDEGIAFLEAARPGWTGLNSFMETHLWWHLALFYLSTGRFDAALAAYDGHVWGVAKDYSQDQVGAVSLLARLELDGVAIGDRWHELAGWLAPRADDVVQPFLSVQYLYGLARGGRSEAGALLDAIRRAAAEKAGAWRVASTLAGGLMAHAEGRWSEAAALIGDARDGLIAIGGSHAQRDLFDQVRLDAAMRDGQHEAAHPMLERRRVHDPDGVPLNRRLAAACRALGREGEAAAAEARVRARLGE